MAQSYSDIGICQAGRIRRVSSDDDRDPSTVEKAATVYRGEVDGIMPAWERLVRWIEDCGYQLAGDCRELYHDWDDDNPGRNVTELQQPIRRRATTS
jgi:effector-binding domain-containing protein